MAGRAKSSPDMKAILKPESININAAPVKEDLSDDWMRVNHLIGKEAVQNFEGVVENSVIPPPPLIFFSEKN